MYLLFFLKRPYAISQHFSPLLLTFVFSDVLMKEYYCLSVLKYDFSECRSEEVMDVSFDVQCTILLRVLHTCIMLLCHFMKF